MKTAELKQKLEDKREQYRGELLEQADMWMDGWLEEKRAMRSIQEIAEKIGALDMVLKFLLMKGGAA